MSFKHKISSMLQAKPASKGWLQARPGVLFLLPSLIGVLVLLVIPYLDVVRRSFTSVASDEFVGLDNYAATVDNAAFALAATNTGLFIAVCIPLLVIVSLALALLIQRQTRWGSYFRAGFLVPLAIPVAVVVLIWQLVFNQSGLLNGFLAQFGIQPTDWMNTDYAFWVLVCSYIWKNLGYSIVLWIAALSSIPQSIYEAARMDGAGEKKIFTHITLPILLPALFTITVLALINSFKVFREAYLVAGNYPHDSMYLLQHVFNNWFTNLYFDKIAAGAVLVSIVLFVLVLLLYKAWGTREVYKR
jgi:multiple sugar transport system permease protein